MLLQTLTFGGNINVSLQPGDIIYYSPTTTSGGSGIYGINTVSTIVTFGICTAVYNLGSTTTIPTVPQHSIVVSYNNNATPAISLPALGDYIMFSKNKEVNSSSIKGYYAEVKLVNASKEKIELFSIGSNISESSK